MNQEKIGKFIAKCRKDKNLTQGELADKLNISNKAISKWETGRGMPDASIMLELCAYLGITVNELLSGEKLEEGEYKEKANENIINIAKESEKNKKVKNKIIIVLTIIIIFSILLLITNIIYRNFEVTLEYDNRLIKCEINNEDIIFVEKPIQRLKEEQKYLSSLPSIDCVSQYFRQNKGYKVSKESMITYKKHKYSVPIKYIGEYLTVSENEDTLNIYYTTNLVASHKISRKIFKLQKRTY